MQLTSKMQISYFFNFTRISAHQKMTKKAYDEEGLLAKVLDAYKSQEFSSLRKAADHYRVSYSKLRGRKNGRIALSDRPTTNNALKSN
jgi:hypothetical protein